MPGAFEFMGIVQQLSGETAVPTMGFELLSHNTPH